MEHCINGRNYQTNKKKKCILVCVHFLKWISVKFCCTVYSYWFYQPKLLIYEFESIQCNMLLQLPALLQFYYCVEWCFFLLFFYNNYCWKKTKTIPLPHSLFILVFFYIHFVPIYFCCFYTYLCLSNILFVQSELKFKEKNDLKFFGCV